MDLLDYSEDKFNAIVEAYRRLAEQLGLKDVHFVPVSALLGDNLVYPGGNMPWYQGEPLLVILENLPGRTKSVVPLPIFISPSNWSSAKMPTRPMISEAIRGASNAVRSPSGKPSASNRTG